MLYTTCGPICYVLLISRLPSDAFSWAPMAVRLQVVSLPLAMMTVLLLLGLSHHRVPVLAILSDGSPATEDRLTALHNCPHNHTDRPREFDSHSQWFWKASRYYNLFNIQWVRLKRAFLSRWNWPSLISLPQALSTTTESGITGATGATATPHVVQSWLDGGHVLAMHLSTASDQS